MKQKQLNKIKWTARITGTILFLLIFPFYIGYGFPFPNSTLTFFENLWLTIIPIFLIGLIIGWKHEKIAGYLITIPITTGLLVSLITWQDPSPIMAIPLLPGILYLIYVFKKK
ncbi:hypothetical protein JXM83_01590 [Candidatus Woesearchaeota archaeon]|nr:hypothetical protein [Candidatus Woesearchaeota archaeon]